MSLTRHLFALGLLVIPVPATAQATITFELLPSEHWRDGEPDLDHLLQEGSVYLYRVGATEPARVLNVGEPGEVPTGDWLWVAEALGYVSTVSGTLVATDELEKSILWPVEPACRIRFSDDPEWSAVARLDVVSVPFGATYPVVPSKRRELWAPAGDLVAYSVGTRGLIGIRRLGRCVQAEEVELVPPSPPPGDRQDFMVSTRPFDPRSYDLDELAVFLNRERGSETPGTVAPSVRIVNGGRISYFFLGVEADGDATLVLEHPRLRTRRHRVQALGGSARELPDLSIEERLDLTLDIDYRPAREHRVAAVEIFHCGRVDRYPGGVQDCRRLDATVELRPGFERYVFDSLDDGKHYLQARIDDEVIAGLGQGIAPFLDPEADEPPRIDPVPLWELEVFGHLLVDGDPVPGHVTLQPAAADQPVLSFPTDDELLYHVYYFGRLPWNWRETSGGRPAEELLGLRGYIPGACSRDGYCRLFSIHSELRGEGRLDMDLGSEHRLRVEVSDADTGDPIPGADVHLTGPPTAIRFDWGEVETTEVRGAEATGTRTDAGGIAKLRLPADGPPWFGVAKEGYRSFQKGDVSGFLAGPADDPLTIEVSLEPDAASPAPVRLVLPNGDPLAHAFVLVTDAGGVVSYRCSRSTDSVGALALPASCDDLGQGFVFHPSARLAPLPGSDLTLLAEAEIESKPDRPLRVRLVDEDGRPLASVPIGLRIGGAVLDANALLAAASRSRVPIASMTSPNGELVLDAVDPRTPGGVELIVGQGDEAEAYDLSGFRSGEEVEIVVDGR